MSIEMWLLLFFFSAAMILTLVITYLGNKWLDERHEREINSLIRWNKLGEKQ